MTKNIWSVRLINEQAKPVYFERFKDARNYIDVCQNNFPHNQYEVECVTSEDEVVRKSSRMVDLIHSYLTESVRFHRNRPDPDGGIKLAYEIERLAEALK